MFHTSAISVIAAIDARRPGLKLAKKHLLMYFMQGHHFAHFDTSLFTEEIEIHGRSIAIFGRDRRLIGSFVCEPCGKPVPQELADAGYHGHFGCTDPTGPKPQIEQPTYEGQLNTIGYVIERYASLSPADLRTLVTTSEPYISANHSVGRIMNEDLAAWFNRDDEKDDPDDERPNRAEMAVANEFWREHKAAQQA